MQSNYTCIYIIIMTPQEIIEDLADGEVFVTGDPLDLIERIGDRQLDVIIEASNTVGPAARYCLAAIEQGCDVVLMNAEVDLALGSLLYQRRLHISNSNLSHSSLT